MSLLKNKKRLSNKFGQPLFVKLSIIQQKYNEEHGITPQTIKKAVRDLISISKVIEKEEMRFEKDPESMNREELEKLIEKVQKQMKKAAADLNFEAAAELRDKMVELKTKLRELDEEKK